MIIIIIIIIVIGIIFHVETVLHFYRLNKIKSHFINIWNITITVRNIIVI